MARSAVTFSPEEWGSRYASHYTRTKIGPKARVICHHTATSQPASPTTGAAFVQRLELYGHNRDGADVEYHVLIDQFGQVYEGFAPQYRGCHCIARDASTGNSKSYNETSLGICFIGYFYPPQNMVPSAPALEAAAHWIAARVFDEDLTSDVFNHATNTTMAGWRGHREVTATACPGTLLTDGWLEGVFARAAEILGGAAVPTPVPPTPTPTPTPPTTGDWCAKATLRTGSTGAEVVKLQDYLMAWGQDLSPYGADGDYGSMTASAVANRQRQLAITADGIYGPQSEAAFRAGGPSPGGTPAPTPPTTTRPTIRKGSKGPDVLYAQQRLQAHGHSLAPYGADGDFGSVTDRATRDFQAAKGLGVDGIIGKNTWEALG